MRTAAEWASAAGNPLFEMLHPTEQRNVGLAEFVAMVQADALQAAQHECDEIGARAMGKAERVYAAACVECQLAIGDLRPVLETWQIATEPGTVDPPTISENYGGSIATRMVDGGSSKVRR